MLDFLGRKDSEESDSGDEEVTPCQRVKILSFLEEASVAEIGCVPGCSAKKADRIAKLRPFGDWTTMVFLSSCSYHVYIGCLIV